jgi:hypothetical protein
MPHPCNEMLCSLSLRAELLVTSRRSNDGVTSVSEIAIPTKRRWEEDGQDIDSRTMKYDIVQS